VLQHALDDAIGAPAVFGNFLEIAGKHVDRFVDLDALVLAEEGESRRGGLLQLL
jgi:hypothetical protein